MTYLSGVRVAPGHRSGSSLNTMIQCKNFLERSFQLPVFRFVAKVSKDIKIYQHIISFTSLTLAPHNLKVKLESFERRIKFIFKTLYPFSSASSAPHLYRHLLFPGLATGLREISQCPVPGQGPYFLLRLGFLSLLNVESAC